MNQSTKKVLASKWLLIVREYEMIKQGCSPNFINLRTLCNTFKVARKDIYKYHARWVAAGQSMNKIGTGTSGAGMKRIKSFGQKWPRLFILIIPVDGLKIEN